MIAHNKHKGEAYIVLSRVVVTNECLPMWEFQASVHTLACMDLELLVTLHLL
jgi:hypothetical protein